MPYQAEECKHLNYTVRGHDLRGNFYCLDCKKQVNMKEVFINWGEELMRLKKELENALSS